MGDKTAEYLPLRTDAKEILTYKQALISGALRSLLAAKYGFERTTEKVKKLRSRTKVEQKEKNPEIKMIAFGNDGVFKLLKGGEKEKTLPNGSKRRLGVVVLGGANACCINTGAVQGMIDAGVFKNVDGVIGISGGAITSMYVGGDNSEEGVKMIFENNTKPDFINISEDPKELSDNLSKLLTGTRAPVIDTTAFADRAVSEGPLALDLEKVKNNDKDLIIVVTNVDTGKPEYINVSKGEIIKRNEQTNEWEKSEFSKSDGNILKAMNASVCLPVMSTEPYTTMENGQRYSDGGVGDFVPLEFAFSQFTDVLILSNYPLRPEANISERLVFNAIGKIAQMQGIYPEKFVDACKNFPGTKLNSLRFLDDVLAGKKGGVLERVAVIAPFWESVDMMEQDGDFMRKVYNHTRSFAQRFFQSNQSKAAA